MLLNYGWTRRAWAEIDSGVLGFMAVDSHGPGELGTRGGQYVVEIMAAQKGRGIAGHMWRAAQREAPGRMGRTELQVHEDNPAAAWYEALGMKTCAAWRAEAAGADARLVYSRGGSMYEPKESHRMLAAAGSAIGAALRRRERERGPPQGVLVRSFTGGLPALAAAGLLEGMRGLGERVYKARAWHRAGELPACLYAGGAGGNIFVILVGVF